MEPSATPANKQQPKRTLWLYLLVLGWLLCSGFGFWWFEYRYWGSYPTQLIQFNPQAIQNLYPILKEGEAQSVLIVHFSDEQCPCESYRTSHLESIKGLLGETQQHTISSWSQQGQALAISASPAVGIWDVQGKLAYFGPYSSGLTCGSGMDFIAMVLDKLAKGENPNWVNNQGFGCFCPWQER